MMITPMPGETVKKAGPDHNKASSLWGTNQYLKKEEKGERLPW
jgi:hypothetical protein